VAVHFKLDYSSSFGKYGVLKESCTCLVGWFPHYASQLLNVMTERFEGVGVGMGLEGKNCCFLSIKWTLDEKCAFADNFQRNLGQSPVSANRTCATSVGSSGPYIVFIYPAEQRNEVKKDRCNLI